MARAKGSDICELFGFAPDDRSGTAQEWRKKERCPFVGGNNACIKHDHPQKDQPAVRLGTCSLVNRLGDGQAEEVIVCYNRLYAHDYRMLKNVLSDAMGSNLPLYVGPTLKEAAEAHKVGKNYAVAFGHDSGKEVSVGDPGIINLSLDWSIACVINQRLSLIIPCEVQSIDTTGNYRSTLSAYRAGAETIPDSQHGMNWANVWKRLIPQIILKGVIAKTSPLCFKGQYFIVPERVYVQFEKLLGKLPTAYCAQEGVLTVMAYGLGPEVAVGSMRELALRRTERVLASDFAQAFIKGKQIPSGIEFEKRVEAKLASLTGDPNFEWRRRDAEAGQERLPGL